MWCEGNSDEGIYLYTPDMEWLWTSRAPYPYFFRYQDSGWLWYLEGTRVAALVLQPQHKLLGDALIQQSGGMGQRAMASRLKSRRFQR